jgi:hypothetical protein
MNNKNIRGARERTDSGLQTGKSQLQVRSLDLDLELDYGLLTESARDALGTGHVPEIPFSAAVAELPTLLEFPLLHTFNYFCDYCDCFVMWILFTCGDIL